MAFPFFYIDNYHSEQKDIVLNEDTSKHVVHVLRMKAGDQLNLTDGRGNLLTCTITDDHKKHCLVKVEETRHKAQGTRRVSVALSLLKNTNRFEWFLEKATEIGVSEIIPLICARTEKEKFRFDRLQGICISAMLQSQQCWLPVLHEPKQFNHLAIQQFSHQKKFIAHCSEGAKPQLTLPCRQAGNQLINQLTSSLILIGPEGDFTEEEITLALENKFIPVSLGETRLRTETAGVVAAALLCHI